MKKFIAVIVTIMVLMGLVSACAESNDEFITEYLYNMSCELHCESLGLIDASLMQSEEDIEAWITGLFPDMTREEILESLTMTVYEDVGFWYKVASIDIVNENGNEPVFLFAVNVFGW